MLLVFENNMTLLKFNLPNTEVDSSIASFYINPIIYSTYLVNVVLGGVRLCSVIIN